MPNGYITTINLSYIIYRLMKPSISLPEYFISTNTEMFPELCYLYKKNQVDDKLVERIICEGFA